MTFLISLWITIPILIYGRHTKCSDPNPCPSSIHFDGTAVREVIKSVVFDEDSSARSHSIITCGLPKVETVSARTAWIFIADWDSPGILYAPLSDTRSNSNLLDTPFTLIPLPGEDLQEFDYDPDSKFVYWGNFEDDQISRIHLDGSGRETILTEIEPFTITLDLVSGKIYWAYIEVARANLDGTDVEYIFTYHDNVIITSILPNTVKGYLLWCTKFKIKHVVKTSLDGGNREIMKDMTAEAMLTEQCADDTTRLFYYYDRSTLGLVNLDRSRRHTIATFSRLARGHMLNKYGSKFYWTVTEGITNFVYEYDMKMSYLRVHNSTVRLTNGSSIEIDPGRIRIIANPKYDEPVAIEHCPNDIIKILGNGSTSDVESVSWSEPVLNSWSSCPTLDFLGPGTNGGNFSLGTTTLTYRAIDAAGNRDICRFSVTLQRNP